MYTKALGVDDEGDEIFEVYPLYTGGVDGIKIFVNNHNVGFVGGHASGVDYYYEERGYGCESSQEVAEQYYRNFGLAHTAQRRGFSCPKGGPTMPDYFAVREDELLARFNALPGVQLERRTFGRYIRPLMVDPRRNEARQAATGRTQPWVYDPTLLWQWDEYLAVRAELIRRGEWGEKRPYSIEDLEGIALMGEHGNVTESLFPAQAEPLEGAGNAP